jgi:hypothetical protein
MDEGAVPYIKCGNDKDHTRPFVRLDNNDELQLHCLACAWTSTVGLVMYSEMKKCLSIFDVEWLDQE